MEVLVDYFKPPNLQYSETPRYAPQASTRFYTLHTANHPRSVSGGFGTFGVSTHSSTVLG